jgi:hypothetical protein
MNIEVKGRKRHKFQNEDESVPHFADEVLALLLQMAQGLSEYSAITLSMVLLESNREDAAETHPGRNGLLCVRR